MLWSIEQTRMMRAGDYISGLESRVNERLLDGWSLGWEGWLNYRAERAGRDIYHLHYYSQYGVLGGFLTILLLSAALLQVGPSLLGDEWPVILDGGIRTFLTVTYVAMACIASLFMLKTVRHGNVSDSLRWYHQSDRNGSDE
ncbi:hypothetical protein [Halosegnis marinus]